MGIDSESGHSTFANVSGTTLVGSSIFEPSWTQGDLSFDLGGAGLDNVSSAFTALADGYIAAGRGLNASGPITTRLLSLLAHQARSGS